MAVKIKFILSFCLLLSSKITIAADILGIGTIYLPESIEILGSKDLITNIILSNTGTFIASDKNSPQDGFKPKKITLTSLNKFDIWELEYNDGPPISQYVKFGPTIIKDSVLFFKNAYPNSSSNNREQSLVRNSLNKVREIDSTALSSGFSVRFKLQEPDPKFIDSISNIPLIDDKAAEIFNTDLGQGTNLPLHGRYLIKEFDKNSQIVLIRNHSFGYSNDQSEIGSITIKMFSDVESRMRALRSGGIAIIVAPSLTEINDAQSDPTLEIINSPFKDYGYTMPNNINFGPNSYDLNRIIVRRSLKPDDNFLKRFQIYGLPKNSL